MRKPSPHETLWTVITAGLIGCQMPPHPDQSAVIHTQILHDLYGPPNMPKLQLADPDTADMGWHHVVTAPLDLNLDGVDETLTLICPDGPQAAQRLIEGQTVQAMGMALFARIRGRLWPLFYGYHDFDGMLFKRYQEGPRRGIVARLGRKGAAPLEYSWHWTDRGNDWRVSKWETAKRVHGHDWTEGSAFWSVYGK